MLIATVYCLGCDIVECECLQIGGVTALSIIIMIFALLLSLLLHFRIMNESARLTSRLLFSLADFSSAFEVHLP